MRNREADFELELTINDGKDEPYDLGNGYGHMAFVVDDIEATRSRIAGLGHAPDDIKQFDREGKNSRGSTSWPIRTGTRPRYWSGTAGSPDSPPAMLAGCAWNSGSARRCLEVRLQFVPRCPLSLEHIVPGAHGDRHFRRS